MSSCKYCSAPLPAPKVAGRPALVCVVCIARFLVRDRAARTPPASTEVHPHCFVCGQPMLSGRGVTVCSQPCRSWARRVRSRYGDSLPFVRDEEPVPPWLLGLPRAEQLRLYAAVAPYLTVSEQVCMQRHVPREVMREAGLLCGASAPSSAALSSDPSAVRAEHLDGAAGPAQSASPASLSDADLGDVLGRFVPVASDSGGTDVDLTSAPSQSHPGPSRVPPVTHDAQPAAGSVAGVLRRGVQQP